MGEVRALPSDLIGSFVVEIGVRQAWPFVGFCDNRSTPPTERRLYIEAGIEVRPVREAATGDSLFTQLVALSVLNGLTVTSTEVDDDHTLHIFFTEEGVLIINGEPGPETSIEPWWVS